WNNVLAPQSRTASPSDITRESAVLRSLRHPAERGDTSAQYTLGLTYHNGDGVCQDDAEAASWYRRAADAGHACAQNNLGLLFLRGHGVPQSDVEAEAWCRKAAAQGNSIAQQNVLVVLRRSRQG